VRIGVKIVCMISFMNRGAGAQQALMRLSQQLSLRGHSVEVWFLYRKSKVDTGDLMSRCILDGYLTPLRLIFLPVRLVRTLRESRPDAVISFLPLANTLGLLSAWLAGVTVRIASHRAPAYTYSTPMRIADRTVGALGLYTAIVCVSRAVRQSFQAYPPNYRARLKVVHNGIAWEAAPSTRIEARRKLGLPPTGFLFVAAGRLSKQKNYFFLLEAFARTTNAYLAIAGDGELGAELKTFARKLNLEDRVLFLGALERGVIPDLLRSADAFVSSSLFEGQSNAVLEAMHEGLPILVSDIPEQRETVVDEVTGEECALLAPVSDTGLWTTQLQRLIDSADLRQQLATSAQQMVVRRFAVERMIDGFEDVLISARATPSGLPEPHCP
jgi:glycosyltransferase involved in cell wall biosynthesis